MLGKYGETLVVDWGLAKPLGHREAGAESDERTLKPVSASGSAPTQMGSAIGTPQYMSPEQAEGRLDSLGPATDIYSLGGTLYCLLAGRTPFAEGDAGTILGHVSKGDFPPPRSIKKDVPPALQAICLKAMALRPADRYPSARALADDVEHWLADEPMAAHHEVFVERAGRWLRRHRAAARAAAVVLLSLSVVSSLAAVLINAARGEAQRQRDIAREAQRAEAAQVVETRKALAAETAAKDAETAAKNAETAAKNEAKAAIDRYVETVQESELLKEERFQPLRKKLLSDALDYYQAFIEAHQHPTAARRDLALALFKVGKISSSSGSKADALAAYLSAVTLWEELFAENPTVTEYQDDLAKSFNNLGMLQSDTGDRPAAFLSYQRALALEEKLVAENPDVAEYQYLLANSYHNLGLLQSETGDRQVALVSYQRALVLREKLAAENPTVSEYQNDLARSHNNLGNLQRDTDDREAALASYQRALALQEKLAADDPTVVHYQVDLGGACCNLANMVRDGSDAAGALVWYARAVQALQGVVDRDDRHITAQEYLRNTHWGRAVTLVKLLRYAEAADDWQRAANLDDGRMRTAFRFSRADALARSGDHVSAFAEAGELAAIDRLSADAFYTLSCFVSLCVAAVNDDPTLADQYAARAIDLLKQAQAAGFFNAAANIERLAKNTDLDALRERDDFRKFVDELPTAPPKSQE